MFNQIEVLAQFRELCKKYRVISISGESGTGKTTFALQLATSFITEKSPYREQCLWVQASEEFSKKRLTAMFKNHPDKLDFLNKNIFVFPARKPFSNYSEQSIALIDFENLILPPHLKYIVIDNISHYLRLETFNNKDLKSITKLINDFYNKQLYPLIMLCQRENYYLILIHEVSYNPNLNKITPFLVKLYGRIKKLNIFLLKSLDSDLKQMKIISEQNSHSLSYEISNIGFLWL